MSETAMRNAIWRGLTSEVARLLAENPALAQSVRPLGYGTFIGHAAGEGLNEIVVLLLDAGCPVDLANRPGGLTALYYADSGRHDDTERLLLSRGSKDTERIQNLRHSIRFLEATAEGRKELLDSLSRPATKAFLNEEFYSIFHEQKKKWLSTRSGEALDWLYENAISPDHGLRYEPHIVQTIGPGDGYGSPDEQCVFNLEYLNTQPRRVRGMHRL